MRSGFGCLAIIMVACGVACGGGSSGSPDAPPGDAGAPAFDVDGAAHSGTRLKLQWYEFDGGRALATMFDATRAENGLVT